MQYIIKYEKILMNYTNEYVKNIDAAKLADQLTNIVKKVGDANEG